MRRLLLLTLLILFFASALYAAEPTIYAIIAADGRAGFGANLVADYNNMERLFKENVPKSRLHLITLEMDEIIPDKILQTISQIELTEKDTLVCYYSGHAAHTAGNGGHYFQLRDEQGKPVELYRRTLLSALKGKKARLTVLLTDCCNVEDKAIDNYEKSFQGTTTPDTLSPVFEALFIKPEGTVDITSSKRGEASFVDATQKKRGSCFTWSLVSLFEKHHDQQSMTWEKFTAELKTDVQKAFLDSHPNGYKFDPPLNGIVVQNTQTIEINGELPGTSREQVVRQKGPRFGVRAVNHQAGGVRITYVLPESPGAKAGFEVGDVILEINGKTISNEQDYSKAIDDSPKSVGVKIINVNDNRILNITFELGY